jgi:lipooligosaccharide transport system permease protein
MDRATTLSVPAEALRARLRIIEYQLHLGRRVWRSLVIGGVFTPLAYVLALGVGLGTVVNRHGSTLGVPYLVFVAPAFLTAAALQIGASDASYPLLTGFKWERTYFGITATPITPVQLCDGQLLWLAMRLTVNSLLYFVIMAAFGGAQRWWVLLAIPVAVLTGMAFASPVAALSATVRSEGNAFNVLSRFVVIPMFLFSGTFYPISNLPQWGQWLAYISPLYHGTALARGAGIGHIGAAAVVGHLVYLFAWLVIGVWLARWRFTVRLTE